MNKKGIKLLCGISAAAVLMSGCSGSADDGKYGSIKTVESPEGFTGNVGDVSIESGDTYAVITIKDFGSVTVKLFPEAAPEGVQNFIDLANSGYYSGKEIHRVIADFMLQGGSRNGDGLSTDEDPSFSVEYNSNMRHFYGALCYANGGGVNGSQFYIVNNKSCKFTTEAELQASLEYSLSGIEAYMTQLEALISASSDADEKAYYQSYYDHYASMKKSTEATVNSQIRAVQEMTEEIEAKYNEVGGYPYLDGGYTVFGQTVDGFNVIDAVSAVEVELNSSGELSHPVEKIVIESVEIFTAE